MDFFVVLGIAIIVIMVLIFIILLINGTSQKGIEKNLTKALNAVMKAQNNAINNNEEILRQSANKTADINKDAIKTMARSVKEGFTDDNSVYCKYCGTQVDADSKFCKKCGKEI